MDAKEWDRVVAALGEHAHPGLSPSECVAGLVKLFDELAVKLERDTAVYETRVKQLCNELGVLHNRWDGALQEGRRISDQTIVILRRAERAERERDEARAAVDSWKRVCALRTAELDAERQRVAALEALLQRVLGWEDAVAQDDPPVYWDEIVSDIREALAQKEEPK